MMPCGNAAISRRALGAARPLSSRNSCAITATAYSTCLPYTPRDETPGREGEEGHETGEGGGGKRRGGVGSSLGISLSVPAALLCALHGAARRRDAADGDAVSGRPEETVRTGMVLE